ncbi:hypothetical protein [Leptospira interrogans]|uniref:hypothetical protein n=1 Tax=Leptospira interrogans TaxID=173 RepID=UPI0007737F6C|nr:hypothetical protein [Leptospira interrogans]WOT10538.1 hypothetical protein CFY92_0016120 [Leptospira interrogans]
MKYLYIYILIAFGLSQNLQAKPLTEWTPGDYATYSYKSSDGLKGSITLISYDKDGSENEKVLTIHFYIIDRNSNIKSATIHYYLNNHSMEMFSYNPKSHSSQDYQFRVWTDNFGAKIIQNGLIGKKYSDYSEISNSEFKPSCCEIQKVSLANIRWGTHNHAIHFSDEVPISSIVFRKSEFEGKKEELKLTSYGQMPQEKNHCKNYPTYIDIENTMRRNFGNFSIDIPLSWEFSESSEVSGKTYQSNFGGCWHSSYINTNEFDGTLDEVKLKYSDFLNQKGFNNTVSKDQINTILITENSAIFKNDFHEKKYKGFFISGIFINPTGDKLTRVQLISTSDSDENLLSTKYKEKEMKQFEEFILSFKYNNWWTNFKYYVFNFVNSFFLL